MLGFGVFAEDRGCVGTGSNWIQVVKMDIVNGSVVSVVE